MRHGKKILKIGRTASHRKAVLGNMASSLILHKRINTTQAKAKALQKFIEPLITKAKTDTTHNRRIVFKYVKNKEAVSELFREVSQKVGDRPGGYTRIIKTGFRKGDAAEIAMIELVDYNEIYTTDKPEKKTRRSRRRRGGKSQEENTVESNEDTNVETKAEEKPAEEAKVEEPAEPEVENTAEDNATEE